jgi:hypothetical protein
LLDRGLGRRRQSLRETEAAGSDSRIGIHLYGGFGSDGTMTLLDHSSGCCSPSRITEWSVNIQYPSGLGPPAEFKSRISTGHWCHLQCFGEIFPAKVCVRIFPSCTMKVSVPISKRLSAVSAFHTM